MKQVSHTTPLTTVPLPGSYSSNKTTNSPNLPGGTSFCPSCFGTGVIEDYQDYGMTTVLAGVYPCDCTEDSIKEYE